MNLCKALLMAITIFAVCELSDAGWLRRAWKAIKKPVCRVACTKVCTKVTTVAGGAVGGPVGAGVGATVGSLACSFPCKKHCKRSIPEEFMNGAFIIVPLDPDFVDYDLDQDGNISLEELAMVTGLQEWDVDAAFKEADANENDLLDQEEFETAPWLFQKKSGAIVPWHSAFNNGKSETAQSNGKSEAAKSKQNS